MDHRQRELLQNSLCDLINNLDIQISIHLRTKLVLTDDHLDLINGEATATKQRLKLLNILKGLNYQCNDLLYALERCNQKHLFNKLQTALSAFENDDQLDFAVKSELDNSSPKLEKVKLLKLWEVPRRNPAFTGRESLFEQLIACFQSNQLQHLQTNIDSKSQPNLAQSNYTTISAVNGLGGVGKTQLAIEFIYRHQTNYSHVFWFPAEETTQIEIAYRKLANYLKIDSQQPIHAIIQEIKAWFNRNPDCLLVYDNAPNSETIHNYLPEANSNVLITSRSTEWHLLQTRNNINVDVFTAKEAREYILKQLQIARMDIIAVDSLAERLSYLPLALAQACAYATKTRLTVSQYLLLYDTHKESLLAENILQKHYNQPVFVTWDITIRKIREELPEAAQLLKYCAYLQSDNIPYILLQALVDDPEENQISKAFLEALAFLGNYSMIKIDEVKSSVSLHRILQEVIRLKKEETENILDYIQTRILIIYPKGNKLDEIKLKISLLPHLEAILQKWDERKLSLKKGIIQPNKDSTAKYDMKILALLQKLQDGYQDLGDYTKERDYLERALKIMELLYGPDHPSVAFTLTNLGNAYGRLRNYTNQKSYLERALKIKEPHYGPDHPEVAITLVNLGNAYGSLGYYTKKKDYLERALKIQEPQYGPDHPLVAISLANLGNAYGRLGDYTQKKDYLERALKIMELHYGPDHPLVASTLHSLDNAYGDLGDYKKKRDYLERALKIMELHFGLDHPEVAITLTNLGNAYGSLGDYTKQRDYLERTFKIMELHYGPDHPEVANTLHSLGNAYGSLGDYKKKRDYLERALPIFQSFYGHQHEFVTKCITDLQNTWNKLEISTKKQDSKKLEKCDVI